MKLYELGLNTEKHGRRYFWIEAENEKDYKNSQVYYLDHLDGAYSVCYLSDEDGKIDKTVAVHLAIGTPVKLCNPFAF